MTETDPGLQEAFELLVSSSTRGHSYSPLRRTCKTTTTLAEEVGRQHHPVRDRAVTALLKASGYCLQANRKSRQGSSHQDRNSQFECINQRVMVFRDHRERVVSIDTKKKELVGELNNEGKESRLQGKPVELKAYDFPDPKKGKAISYGVYDLASNEGWVSFGD